MELSLEVHLARFSPCQLHMAVGHMGKFRVEECHKTGVRDQQQEREREPRVRGSFVQELNILDSMPLQWPLQF